MQTIATGALFMAIAAAGGMVVGQETMGRTATTEAINWNTIVLAVISLVGTAVSGIIAYYMARLNTATLKTLDNSEITKKATVEQADSLDKVHTAVNSTATAAQNEIKELRRVVLELAKSKATLEERVAGDRTMAAALTTPAGPSTAKIVEAGESLNKAGVSLKAAAGTAKKKKR